MKKRILILRATSLRSDPRLEKEGSALAEAGYSVRLLGWDREQDYQAKKVSCFEACGHEIEKVLIGVKGSYGSGLKNIFALCRFEMRLYTWLITHGEEFDVLHACDLDTGYIASLVAKKLNKILVYDVFDFYAESRNIPKAMAAIARELEYRVVKRSNATIICTDERRRQIAPAIEKTNVIVIENTAIDEPDLRSSSRSRDGHSIVLSYTGTLGRDRLLEEAVRAICASPGLEIDIAGTGPLEGYVLDISGTCESVRYHGQVSHRAALEIEANSDLILALYDPRIPNNVLTASNKFYEGLMLGVPILTTEGTAIGDLVEKHGVGCAIKATFDTQLFESSVKAIVERNGDLQISKRAQALYDSTYSWNCMADRLTNLYADLMHRS